jgi:hypothetical protein
MGWYGSEWVSNPPQPVTQPAADFEDRDAHRDVFTPMKVAL